MSAPVVYPVILPAGDTPPPDFLTHQVGLSTVRFDFGTRLIGITSINGSSTLAGTSGGLGNAVDQALLLYMRALSDVVFVGAQTIRSEKYGPIVENLQSQRIRRTFGRDLPPRIATLTATLDFSGAAEFFAGTPPLIFTTFKAARRYPERLAFVKNQGAEVIFSANLSPRYCVGWLRRAGMTNICVEGGTSVITDLMSADLVDHLHLTLSPCIIDSSNLRLFGNHIDDARHFQLHSLAATDDGTVFLHYERSKRYMVED
ncbi:dihydrofolate reductase family protein [Corynebacterium sp. ES2794-CONJ1]|uniref:dihydrofolate reductase family protein n=1 Tax=Corynebacterium sp. ES2794-CONJ1 TaxID=2980553 RepID=UPI0021DA569D|nr:dihydrofolate reductase family protein [Corynebacterium sp. ES2794-CONJ1]MCU9518463.1 dihydrofolate reductase family protein [Corynebacterium sp. ES2794-CONJ1]